MTRLGLPLVALPRRPLPQGVWQRGRPGSERNARHPYRADPAAGPPPPPLSRTAGTSTTGHPLPPPAVGRVRVEVGCSGETAVLPSTLPFALTFAEPAPAPRPLPPAAAAARYDDAAQCHVLLDPDSRLASELIPLVTYLRRQHPNDQRGS